MILFLFLCFKFNGLLFPSFFLVYPESNSNTSTLQTLYLTYQHRLYIDSKESLLTHKHLNCWTVYIISLFSIHSSSTVFVGFFRYLVWFGSHTCDDDLIVIFFLRLYISLVFIFVYIKSFQLIRQKRILENKSILFDWRTLLVILYYIKTLFVYADLFFTFKIG